MASQEPSRRVLYNACSSLSILHRSASAHGHTPSQSPRRSCAKRRKQPVSIALTCGRDKDTLRLARPADVGVNELASYRRWRRMWIQGVDEALGSQRVLADPNLYGPSHHLDAGLLGSEMDGGVAEYFVVPAANAMDMAGCPLNDIELTAFPITRITAESMCKKEQIEQGMTIVVTGASGGVGSAALKVVKERGAKPVAVTSGDKDPKLNVNS